MESLFSWLSLVMMITACFYASQSVYGQVFCGKSFLQEFCNTRTQQWVDSEHSIRIIFTILPTDPIIGNVTQLKFNVEDLKSGSLLKNLTAKLVVINNLTAGNSQTSDGGFSAISNITAPNGIFSISYDFLQEGKHQILLRVDSKNNFSALASFYFTLSSPQL